MQYREDARARDLGMLCHVVAQKVLVVVPVVMKLADAIAPDLLRSSKLGLEAL